MSTPRPPCQHKNTYERLLRLVSDRNYHCKATYETVCQDCETVVPEGVAAPLELSAREFAQKWILDHLPEPLKCMYCGKAQTLNLGPICSGATWLDSCPNSPTTGHTYQMTVGGEDRRQLDSAAEMLKSYAAAVSKNLQEELAAMRTRWNFTLKGEDEALRECRRLEKEIAAPRETRK